MQNYDLPDANTGNTFNGAVFTFADIELIPEPEFFQGQPFDTAELSVSPGFGLEPVLQLSSERESLRIETGRVSSITITPFLVALPPGLYHWDLKITFADGRIKTYIGGKWRINPIITV